MKKFILVISQFFILLILFSIQISDSFSNKVENQTFEMKLKSELKVNPDFGNIPLYFIPNKGQVGEKALYYAKTSKFTLWITKNGLVFDSTRKIKNRDDNRTTTFDYSEKKIQIISFPRGMSQGSFLLMPTKMP